MSLTKISPLANQVLDAYKRRDSMAKQEQDLEDTIFSKVQRSAEEANKLGKQYQSIKDKRAQLSIKSAVLYMQLSPADKEYVTAEWKRTEEGLRKQQGSGLRGK